MTGGNMHQTGEIYEVLDAFERGFSSIPGYCPRDFTREERPIGNPYKAGRYYQNGTVNSLFCAYLAGHAHGRCYERSQA